MEFNNIFLIKFWSTDQLIFDQLVNYRINIGLTPKSTFPPRWSHLWLQYWGIPLKRLDDIDLLIFSLYVCSWLQQVMVKMTTNLTYWHTGHVSLTTVRINIGQIYYKLNLTLLVFRVIYFSYLRSWREKVITKPNQKRTQSVENNVKSI